MHDEHDQDDRFDQGVLHRLDRGGDEFGRVVGDADRRCPAAASALTSSTSARTRSAVPRALAPGCWTMAMPTPRWPSKIAADAVVLGAEFDAGDVAHAGDPALGVGLDDDVGELVGIGQTALHLDRQLEGGGVGGEGRLADGAGGGLDVLAAQGGDDVGGGQIARGGLGRVDPDPHRIVAAAEDLDAADALDAQQPVAQRRVGVVADIVVVQDCRPGEVRPSDHQEAGSLLVHDHADLAHLLRAGGARPGRRGSGPAPGRASRSVPGWKVTVIATAPSEVEDEER